MKKILVVLLFFSVNAHAGIEPSPSSKIKRIVTYAAYGDGDTQVVLEAQGTTCKDGYYLKKSNPNSEAMLSMLFAAYHAKTPIMIDGHTDQKWAGSSGYYCKIYSIRYGY